MDSGNEVNAHLCCQVAERGPTMSYLATTEARVTDSSPWSATLLRRCFYVVRLLIPGAILALLPKCPVCIAAYFALVTGVGISISSAAYARILLVALCMASLSYLAARYLYPLISSSSGNSQGVIDVQE
jgi:hypothetical protein